MPEPPNRALRRAVVTGGAGFIGSHLCEHLLGRRYEVICFDNFITGTPSSVAHLIRDKRFSLVHHDVTESLPISGKVDLILHFASPASPTDYLRLPIDTLRVGSLGTMRALDLARQKQARFVLASTSEVYGDPLEHPQRENYWGNVNPVGPRGAYDEAKRFAEALTTAYRTSHAVNAAIVRLFNIYGPRMRPDDGRAIPTFIRQALTDSPITVTGDGSQTRSICYIDDTIGGILALADSEYAGPINIGNPAEVTILDLALRIKEITKSRSPVHFIERPTDDPQTRRPDTTLARQLLGWQPSICLEQGIQRTIHYQSTLMKLNSRSQSTS